MLKIKINLSICCVSRLYENQTNLLKSNLVYRVNVVFQSVVEYIHTKKCQLLNYTKSMNE